MASVTPVPRGRSRDTLRRLPAGEGALAASVRSTFPRPRLLTRGDFLRFAADQGVLPDDLESVHLVPCTCGDINCHGWRFVAIEESSC